MNNKIEKINNYLKELSRKKIKTLEEVEKQQEMSIQLQRLLDEEIAPLIIELNMIGLEVNSIWDLVNSKKGYLEAIPILLEHLTRDYSEKNKEGIVRSLAVKEAIGKIIPTLLNEYNKSDISATSLRWAIGNTIYTTITKNDEDQILSLIQIVKNKANGKSRQMFIMALGKTKSPIVEDVLINLLDDEEVIPYALDALGRIKSIKSKEKVSTLLKHKNELVRKEAKKTLMKIP